jgi:hypothetical protein
MALNSVILKLKSGSKPHNLQLTDLFLKGFLFYFVFVSVFKRFNLFKSSAYPLV